MLYLGTSALAKLYVTEAESAQMGSVVEPHQPWLYTSRVTYAEVLSLLARIYREGRMGRAAYQRQKLKFLREWSVFHAVELTQASLAPAERIIGRYALRGFDAIQLCSALSLGTPEFACFDSRLRLAAKAEGLAVVP